jgi:hypothetical protein
MKNSKTALTLTFSFAIVLMLVACNSEQSTANKDSDMGHDHNKMEQPSNVESKDSDTNAMHDSKAITPLIESYLAVKNALVQDDEKAAAQSGSELVDAVSGFDLGAFNDAEQSELKEILEVIKEHAEHVSKSEIAHQREHFAELAKDFQDLITITGTDRNLYEQYCPMYNNNEGGHWLSASEEIRNPLFGSKMLKCGKVTKQL